MPGAAIEKSEQAKGGHRVGRLIKPSGERLPREIPDTICESAAHLNNANNQC